MLYPDGWEPDFAALEKELEECGGVFGFKGCSLEHALMSSSCTDRCPCPRLVSLYARMGLHRFNLLQGTKFKLERVEKYVSSIGTAAATYYITLDAVDGSSLETFEIEVSEKSANTFALMCNVARIQGDKRRDKGAILMDTRLPEWPPLSPFEKQYLVNKSELQDNDDWIRLYVELAVAKADSDSELDFDILKVAMDVEPPNDDGLNVKNAAFYIRYKDLHEARLSKYSNRIAIVRRRFDEDTGCFSLVGETRSLERLQLRKRKFADTGCVLDHISGLVKFCYHSDSHHLRKDREAADQQAVKSRDGHAAGESMEWPGCGVARPLHRTISL